MLFRSPRHGIDGNAVSKDAYAGPPRRVRWVTGPYTPIGDMVSAGGRNYYANLAVRDSFNGLPVWRADRGQTGWSGDSFPAKPGTVTPVAIGDRLYVVDRGALTAVDGYTGEVLQTYPEAGAPFEMVIHDGTIYALNTTSVRAVDVETGKQLWIRAVSDPHSATIGEDALFLTEGNVRRGQARIALRLNLKTGAEEWRVKSQQYKSEENTFSWLTKAGACVYYDGMLAFEVSSFTDFGDRNGIYVMSAKDGSFLWSHAVDGMGHWKQARVTFLRDAAVVLNGYDVEQLDPKTGELLKTHKSFGGHCFPPVGLRDFFLSGEMSLTDVITGAVDSNRITKSSCSRSSGVMPANGLLYATPKSCTCWPMLHGVVAMAPAREGGPLVMKPSTVRYVGDLDPKPTSVTSPGDWPAYRRDAWRSGTNATPVPTDLQVLWSTKLPGRQESRFRGDWEENLKVRGPVTGPVVAGGLTIVAQPDAHRVVAMDADTGEERWSFTADGRVDTPPTVHQGLCLFGSRAGRVYCLRARDGSPVWEIRLVDHEERIVSHAQIESPWPIAGSVLVDGDTAYFAAGLQYLADGGIRVFAVDPWTGEIRWSAPVTDLPDFHYYAGAGLEFDAYDLLVKEGNGVSMSRWQFAAGTGELSIDRESGYVRAMDAMAPRGLWTYGSRQFYGGKSRVTKRPLAVFNGSRIFSCTDDKQSLFRRDFTAEDLAAFDTKWYANRDRVVAEREGKGDYTRQMRLAHGAAWTTEIFDEKNSVGALVLTRGALFAAGVEGGLVAVDSATGAKIIERDMPPLVWDGLIAANERLYATTQDGTVLCLGSN